MANPTGSTTKKLTPSEFLKKYAQDAMKEGVRSGIPPSVILGQMAEESGWGNSLLATKYNNFFGVKAGSSWKGPTVRLHDTVEGSYDEYRVYATPLEGLMDHSKVLKNGLYDKAFQVPTKPDGQYDPYKFVYEVAQGGYAQNPTTYYNHVSKIMKDYNFPMYDTISNYTLQGVPSTGKDYIQDHSVPGDVQDQYAVDTGQTSGLNFPGQVIKVIIYLGLGVVAAYCLFHFMPKDVKDAAVTAAAV